MSLILKSILSVCMLNCSVNRQAVMVRSGNVGWQIILNAFCAIDSFFFIGYDHILYFVLMVSVTYATINKKLSYHRYSMCKPCITKTRLSGPLFVTDNTGLAAVDLMQLATKAAVLCEITCRDGLLVFEVTQGHKSWYQLKAHMKLPISE